MDISQDSRKTIADEFEYVAKRMKEEQQLPTKLYFFTGSYNILHRIYNLEFDPSLLLIHNVLQSTYEFVSGRLGSIVTGQERVVSIPQGLFDSLADTLKQLGNAIRNNEDFVEPLQRIVMIGYATTGNGYYLYQKGILKI